jgi:quercetin dioxygenase-like cupin family protein
VKHHSRIIEDPLSGQRLTFVETAADTSGRFVRAEVHLKPGGFVPRHFHLRQDEKVEVLSGSIRFRARGRDRVLNVGDTAAIKRRHMHRVSNAGPGEATFVLEVHPARHIEQTIRSTFAVGRLLSPLGRLRRPGRAPTPT